MLPQAHITQAVNIIKQGGTIAYPTEAVFGLGCDPFNEIAVNKILKLKNRSIEKGLIVVAANFEQIQDLVAPIDPNLMQQAKDTWPGPITWVFPASNKVPKWISGKHHSIAIRVSAYPAIQELCSELAGPLVSTSANLEGEAPLQELQDVVAHFGDKISYVIPGEVGNLIKPTEIRDVLTGQVLRK